MKTNESGTSKFMRVRLNIFCCLLCVVGNFSPLAYGAGPGITVHNNSAGSVQFSVVAWSTWTGSTCGGSMGYSCQAFGTLAAGASQGVAGVCDPGCDVNYALYVNPGGCGPAGSLVDQQHDASGCSSTTIDLYCAGTPPVTNGYSYECGNCITNDTQQYIWPAVLWCDTNNNCVTIGIHSPIAPGGVWCPCLTNANTTHAGSFAIGDTRPGSTWNNGELRYIPGSWKGDNNPPSGDGGNTVSPVNGTNTVSVPVIRTGPTNPATGNDIAGLGAVVISSGASVGNVISGVGSNLVKAINGLTNSLGGGGDTNVFVMNQPTNSLYALTNQTAMLTNMLRGVTNQLGELTNQMGGVAKFFDVNDTNALAIASNFWHNWTNNGGQAMVDMVTTNATNILGAAGGVMGSSGSAISNGVVGVGAALATSADSSWWQWDVSIVPGVSRTWDLTKIFNGDALENSQSAPSDHPTDVHGLGITGVKSWIRTMFVWLAYILLFMWISSQISSGLIAACQVQGFQISSSSGGVVDQALLGLPQVGARNAMLIGLAAILLTFPALCVAILGTVFTAMGTDTATAMTQVAAGVPFVSGPNIVYQLWTMLNSFLPLFEWFLMAGNIIVGQLLIDNAVSLLVLKVKMYGL